MRGGTGRAGAAGRSRHAAGPAAAEGRGSAAAAAQRAASSSCQGRLMAGRVGERAAAAVGSALQLGAAMRQRRCWRAGGLRCRGNLRWHPQVLRAVLGSSSIMQQRLGGGHAQAAVVQQQLCSSQLAATAGMKQLCMQLFVTRRHKQQAVHKRTRLTCCWNNLLEHGQAHGLSCLA